MVITGVILFMCFVIFQIYMTTSPIKIVNSIKKGYKGIVISKKQIAQRNSHSIIVFCKENNNTVNEIFRQELDSIVEVGDYIIKPKNDNYLFLIKPNMKKQKFIYTYISKENREDFRWPKEWKSKWIEAKKPDVPDMH